MKDILNKLIDSVVSGDDDAAKKIFSEYASEKTKAMLSEGAQQDMFGDGEKQKPSKRFLVKPTGVSYADEAHAISAAKNHPDKDVSVLDTETDKIVYSHKAKGKKSLNEASCAFDVFDSKGKKIDTVFSSDSDTAEDVKKSLVYHDGYDSDIVVKKCSSKKGK